MAGRPPQPVEEPPDFGPRGHCWLPVLLAMPRRLRDLGRDGSRGLLGHTLLYAYAAAPDMFHRKAWAMINRKQ